MSPGVQITSRGQYEVLRLFAAGRTEQQIADSTTFDVRMVARTVNDLCGGDRPAAKDLVAAFERRASAVAAAQGKTAAPLARPAAAAAADASARPAVTVPAATADLLKAAASSPHQKTRNLGVKVGALLADLEARITAERERAAAEAQRAAERAAAEQRVAELHAQLTKAREQLKTLAANPTTTPRASGRGASAKTIRSWAARAGVECAATGRVPQDVVDAYYAAHPDAPRP